jgi:hypothetical protein
VHVEVLRKFTSNENWALLTFESIRLPVLSDLWIWFLIYHMSRTGSSVSAVYGSWKSTHPHLLTECGTVKQSLGTPLYLLGIVHLWQVVHRHCILLHLLPFLDLDILQSLLYIEAMSSFTITERIPNEVNASSWKTRIIAVNQGTHDIWLNSFPSQPLSPLSLAVCLPLCFPWNLEIMFKFILALFVRVRLLQYQQGDQTASNSYHCVK